VKAADVRLPEGVAARVAARAEALGELAGVDAAGHAALAELAERLRNTYPYGEPGRCSSRRTRWPGRRGPRR
jgi:hypothetical protein